MSPAELAWRAWRALSSRLEAARAARPDAVPSASRCVTAQREVPELEAEQVRAIVAAADAIIDGRLEIFGRHYAHYGFPPQWNVDAESGVEAPLQFGKRLDYRDARLVGNIKTLWEPARHLQLVTLAQAMR